MALAFFRDIGKGLVEQVGLQRILQIFNADLGIVLDSTFGNPPNFPAQVNQSTTTFNFSGLHPNHEACVAWLYCQQLPRASTFTVSFTWNRPNGSTAVNFNTTFSTPTGVPGNTYDTWLASWIGTVPTEIDISGTWAIITTVTGGATFFNNTAFTVSNYTNYASFQLGASAQGKIWDENGGIAFVDFNGIKHVIPTTAILSAAGAQDGQIWIDTTLGSGRAKLAMTHGGLQVRTNRTILPDKFFPSTFATSGHIWCDSFRRGCLNFIYSDGKRYAISDGTFVNF